MSVLMSMVLIVWCVLILGYCTAFPTPSGHCIHIPEMTEMDARATERVSALSWPD